MQTPTLSRRGLFRRLAGPVAGWANRGRKGEGKVSGPFSKWRTLKRVLTPFLSPMKLSLHAFGWVAAIALGSAPLHAGGAEERAFQSIERLGGKIVRDEAQKGKPVVEVDLSATQMTDAQLKELAPLGHLEWLSLKGTKVTDGGLKELATFKRLATLSLNDTKVTDAGMKDVAALKQLRWLGLDGTAITDKGVGELVPLKQLDTLVLGSMGITDASLKELEALDQLAELRLADTKITDAGLEHLAHFKRLNALHLINAKITDAGLKELANLRQLRALTLWSAQVTDAGLKDISKLRELGYLDLYGTRVSGSGLKELAELKRLRTLSLVATKVGDAGVKELAPFQQLHELALDKTQVTSASLKDIARLKNLRGLGLNGTKVTDVGLGELAGLMHLQSLALNGTQVTDAGLKELVDMDQLRALYLRDTKVTDAGVRQLQKALPKCRIAYDKPQEAERADQPPLEAEAIWAKAIEAHGGKRNILKPRKAHLKSVEDGDPKNRIAVEDWFDLPDRWKTERVDFPDGKKRTRFALKIGRKLWEWEDGGKIRQSAEADRMAIPYFGIFVKMAEMADGGKYKLSPIKGVEVFGKPALGLRVLWKNDKAEAYFDRTSGLLARWDVIWEPKPGERFHQKTLFDEYKEIDGVKIPHRQRVYITDGVSDYFQVSDLVLKEATILKKLPEDTFALPTVKKNPQGAEK